MTRKPRIYVSGALTLGNQAENVARAVRVGNQLFTLGYVPFIPHLTWFWEFVCGPRAHSEWLSYDAEWVVLCDGLLRLEGESKGADIEECIARGKGIPVFHSVAEVMDHFGEALK